MPSSESMNSGLELNLDRETFLARHWQSKPLLIRQFIEKFKPPISSHQLAGLAMEEEVESRIIENVGGDWKLDHGPFGNTDYQRDNPWTLLVQAVDHYIPEVAELRKMVDFIPQWRVDDVMVSYAVNGGSVGPHYDNYDVFLLQGEGERLWKVGQFCDDQSPLLHHDELRILSLFECEQEYLLGPGDMLYIPPGVAHWGIAQGDCTTFSIGFRAPRINDLVSRFVDSLLGQIDSEQFYSDSRLEPVSRPGEIRPRDLERVQAQVQAALDQASGDHWFGELVTEPRSELMPDDDDLAEARAELQGGCNLVGLSPAARLAWQQDSSGLVVYTNGESRQFSTAMLALVTELCEHWKLEGKTLETALADEESSALLDHLLETGCIYVE
jgi:50S ribosomal protein L16 3-hydroxylase